MNNSQYPNLHTSLTSLKSHIHSSKSTLNSLPFQFPPSNPLLLQCPSNPTHHVPPSSLFHHFLHCPTSLHVSPLNYPTTLTSTPVDNFTSPITSDLCLSIDEFVGFESSFFYCDCPGVVGDGGNGNRVFTLPRVLSVECGTTNGNGVLTSLSGVCNDGGGGNSKRVSSVECGTTNETLSGVGNGVDGGNSIRGLSVECGTTNKVFSDLPGSGNDVDGGDSKRVLSVECGQTDEVFLTLPGIGNDVDGGKSKRGLYVQCGAANEVFSTLSGVGNDVDGGSNKSVLSVECGTTNEVLSTLPGVRNVGSGNDVNGSNKSVLSVECGTTNEVFSTLSGIGNDVDGGNSKRVLPVECGTENEVFSTLPGIGNDVDGGKSKRGLSVECGTMNEVFSTHPGVVMLPSEMWVVSNEVGLWSDFPDEYSYSVLRGLLCLNSVDESVLLTWLIGNSPRFGVVIDVPMRDHMSVLFRVCFKAMVREASCSYGGLFESDEGGGCRKLDPKLSWFKCPVLGEAMRWLVSQLSILYGEMNAKGFVIASLGHVLRNAVSCALLFPLDRKLEKIEVSKEIVENGEDDRTDVRLFSRSIFVYQIAAAVAALHERSLLEARIRALRNPPPLTAYQRMVEHQHFSKKADEERQKRLDYRPLMEHDSIFSQQQNDQETNRLKTREELLAEERDYKRRRMSYRGKKHKRSPKEVMRDIIEEYMEAIKQIGGIGGLANEDAGPTSTWKNTSTQSQKSMNLETNHDLKNDRHDSYRTALDSGHKTRDKRSDPSPCRKEQQQKSESYYYRNHDQTMNEDRFSRDHRSRSPSRDRRHSQSKEHRNHRRNEHITKMDDNEGSRRNYSTSSAQWHSSGRRDKRKLESSDRGRWNNHESDERGSYERIEFSDRYNPSEDDHFIDN